MNVPSAGTPEFCFQTPEPEVRAHLDDRREPNSLAPGGIEDLLRQQLASAPRDLSLVKPGAAGEPERTAAARDHLKELLILRESLGQPLEVRLISRREEEDHSIEEISFVGTPPLRIPATVVVPRNGAARHPAVVALHSMGGLRLFGREKLLAFPGEPAYLSAYRQANYGGRSLQLELARRGYLSIAIDACGFGERCLAAFKDREKFCRDRLDFTDREVAEWASRSGADDGIFQRSLLSGGLSLAALVATDDLRSVDYLCSRDDVDPQRIGCTGLSFGSFRSNSLSALDDRVRAAVSVCWISSLAGILNYNIIGSMGFFALPQGLYQRMDLTDIVALSAPKPFLAISGWQDRLMQPSGMAEAHLALREVWAASGSGAAFGSLIYDTGHEYNAAMQEAALAFFDRHLGQ